MENEANEKHAQQFSQRQDTQTHEPDVSMFPDEFFERIADRVAARLQENSRYARGDDEPNFLADIRPDVWE